MRASVYHLSIPMQCYFNHAEAERKAASCVLLVIDHMGVQGIGECAPRIYVTGETVNSVMTALQQLNMQEVAAALDMSSLDAAVQSIIKLSNYWQHKTKILPLNAGCVVEMALLDLVGKYFNKSVQEILQTYCVSHHLQPKNSLLNYKTSQVMDLSFAPEDFLQTRKPFHHIKIKVNGDLENNVSRIKAIRDAVGHQVPITVDANMAWNLEEAKTAVAAFKNLNIAYYEEPLAKGKLADYQQLRLATDAKILLDESLCSVEDGRQAIAQQACDAFNIRISKCGGLLQAISLVEMAVDNGLAFQLGAQVAEAGPLIAAGRHLAGAVDGYFTFEGGQPDRFFAGNYIVDAMPLVDRATNLAYPIKAAGLGVSLNKGFAEYVLQRQYWCFGKWNGV